MRPAVEAAGHWGDNLFNTPLIAALSRHYGVPVDVATLPDYRDAFENLPFVGQIFDMSDKRQLSLVEEVSLLGSGVMHWKQRGNGPVYPITQFSTHELFLDREGDPPGLFGIPTAIGRQLGLPEFDPRPILNFTVDERKASEAIPEGTVAVETGFLFQQSWVWNEVWQYLLEEIKNRPVLCLSREAPINGFLRLDLTRRELLCGLHRCHAFVTTGSGFFCGSIGVQYRGPVLGLLRPGRATLETVAVQQRQWLNAEWCYDFSEFKTALQRLKAQLGES